MKKLLLSFLGIIVLAMSTSIHASSISLDLNDGRIKVKGGHQRHHHHHSDGVFRHPRWEGRNVDWCYGHARDCGGPAAEEFCRKQGFAGAESWIQQFSVGNTISVGTNETCNDYGCDGFKEIRCIRERPRHRDHHHHHHRRTTFDHPTSNGIPVDWCLQGWRCGAEAAEEFCRNKGFGRAVKFEREYVGRSIALDTGDVCTRKCTSFSFIECK